jgi:hypothetical protein
LLQTSEKVFARRQSLPQVGNPPLESRKRSLGLPLNVALPIHRPIRQQASLAGFSSASLDLFPEFELQAQRTPQYLLALTAELREHSVEPLDLCVCFLELAALRLGLDLPLWWNSRDPGLFPGATLVQKLEARGGTPGLCQGGGLT